LSLTSDLSDLFFTDLLALCGRLGIDALDLMGVIMAESGAKASARNPVSDASGLIQFLPSTLAHLGWTDTPEAFRQLSAAEQLPYVEAHFQPYVHFGLKSAARVYQAVFLPASLSLGSSNETVIAAKGGIHAAAYEGNRGLDRDLDGAITVGELQKAIERRHNSPRWHEIVDRIRAAGESQTGGPSIDLRTHEGVSDALEALGFGRSEYSFVAAVRAFQRRSGLSSDGIVGPRTRAALSAALDENGIEYRT
jgi:hypothetical protein